MKKKLKVWAYIDKVTGELFPDHATGVMVNREDRPIPDTKFNAAVLLDVSYNFVKKDSWEKL
jgi:hypothetical protein